MEIEHVWTTIPSGSDTDGNGIFASSQYWFEANKDGYNTAGYMGSQVSRRGDGSEKRNFIFSCWDADGSHQVSWDHPNCARFGGEGVGSHCMLELPIAENTIYSFRVYQSKSDTSGAHWTGEVTDTTTGKSHVVGVLVFPHVGGYDGFGHFQVNSDDFYEYFAGGDCNAARAGVGTNGPFFHSRTLMPTQAYPRYGSGACGNTDVEGSVPGAPHDHQVFMTGGRGVVRRTSTGQALWVPSPPSPSPSPSPTPSGVSLVHKGRACQSQTVNLGNTYDTPETCAQAAGATAQCSGIFMHSANYWSSWGCRCCADEQPGEYNDNWNIYSYAAATSALATKMFPELVENATTTTTTVVMV